ncbi:MAG: hypothetical protein KY455_01905 [Euryarchaeota archaeon]|nr:hypothetical protein [Euryarchaeota archaeon]
MGGTDGRGALDPTQEPPHMIKFCPGAARHGETMRRAARAADPNLVRIVHRTAQLQMR